MVVLTPETTSGCDEFLLRDMPQDSRNVGICFRWKRWLTASSRGCDSLRLEIGHPSARALQRLHMSKIITQSDAATDVAVRGGQYVQAGREL